MKKQSSFSSSSERKGKGKVLALWAETQTYVGSAFGGWKSAMKTELVEVQKAI